MSRDLIFPSSGPLTLNMCVVPLENLNATPLLLFTDPAFFVSRVLFIDALVPLRLRKTCEKKKRKKRKKLSISST